MSPSALRLPVLVLSLALTAQPADRWSGAGRHGLLVPAAGPPRLMR